MAGTELMHKDCRADPLAHQWFPPPLEVTVAKKAAGRAHLPPVTNVRDSALFCQRCVKILQCCCHIGEVSLVRGTVEGPVVACRKRKFSAGQQQRPHHARGHLRQQQPLVGRPEERPTT